MVDCFADDTGLEIDMVKANQEYTCEVCREQRNADDNMNKVLET
jgi:hypothetical protein